MNNNFIYETKNTSNKVVVNNKIFGNSEKIIIAGPCTFGSYKELYKIAKELKQIGIKFLRAGAYKSRTNPYSYQGLGDKGIEILLKIKKELKLGIVTELMTAKQVKKFGEDIDIIQIGARNMFNYDLLKVVGKLDKPVLLKRSFMATYKEWLLAAEYILKEGNNKVILCERGIRSFNSTETRNVLDIQAIPFIKKHCNLPILIDPSHASGKSYMVESMSKASLIAGADGLIIETHIDPKSSLCDSEQTIDIETLKRIIDFKEKVKKYED